jgi:hypothetical protein
LLNFGGVFFLLDLIAFFGCFFLDIILTDYKHLGESGTLGETNDHHTIL